MQSSSRVIKSTVVDDNKLISPPTLESVLKKSIEVQDSGFSIEDIYERIKIEARSEANEIKDKLIREAQEKARLILENASLEADNLKKSAQDDGFQQGYGKGYQEGYEHGMNEANKAAAKLVGEAEEYLRACHDSARRYIKDSQNEIINLSISIARKILNTELTVNTEAILKMTEALLSKAIDKSQVVLRVNPQDYNLIKNRKEELSIYVEDASSLLIVADSGIEPGSLRAETPSGFIDGSVETQLDIILKNLLKE